jgi:hypothetical protein
MSLSRTTNTQTLIALTAIKTLSRRAKKLPKHDRLLTLCASPVTTRRASLRLCLQAATRVTSKEFRKKFSHMQCCASQQRLISRNSNMTIVITRGFPACFVIVVKITHRNRHFRAKLHTRRALVATPSSFRIQRARSARSVTPMVRVERSKRFRRCVALMRGLITRNIVVLRVRVVIDEIVAALGSRFRRG